MKIVNATLMITRKCNLSCTYCKIVDNKFPNELTGEQWNKALNILHNKLGCQFNVLLGGEPTQHKDILQIIDHCNENDIPYGLSTNGVITKKFKDELIKHKLRNFSISYDGSDDLGDLTANRGSKTKSNTGLKNAIEMQFVGIPDIHATITVTDKNVMYLLDIVRMLTSYNIWAEITAIHWSKGEKYDFFPTKKLLGRLTLDDTNIIRLENIKKVMNKLKEWKESGRFRIHNEAEYFDDFLKYAFDLDWKCKSCDSLCIDSDGKMRTCLHYNGEHCKKFTIFDLEDPIKQEEFEEAHKKDRDECRGCWWDCCWQAEHIDKNKAKEVFQHGK